VIKRHIPKIDVELELDRLVEGCPGQETKEGAMGREAKRVRYR